MANAQLHEFHTCGALAAFFLVGWEGSRYAVVFGHDQGRTETTMSVFGPGPGGRLASLRTLTVPGVDIRSADGRLVDGDLLFAIESNAYSAIEWTRSDFREIVVPARTAGFLPVWEGGLAKADAQRVDLPIEHQWNVMTPLPPTEWLFEPRFLGGAEILPEVVVSTADGQVALLRPSAPAIDAASETRFVTVASDEPKGTPSAITEAFAPRACRVDGALVVSLLRPGGPTYPFEIMEKRSAGVPPSAAALVVVEDQAQEHDLSRELDLGPMIEHTLVLGHDGSLWLFALQDADVGTELVALHRDGAGAWVVRGRKRFTRELWRVSALAGDADAWHLVLGEKRDRGWALVELLWRIGAG